MPFSTSGFLLVSIGYVVAFSINTGFFLPMQKLIVPSMDESVTLVFLPHGIRILAIIYFGWMGLIYLTPSVLGMWALAVYGSGQTELHMAGSLVSLLSCYVGVMLVCRYLFNGRDGEQKSWRHILIAGFFASVLNSLGLTALQKQALVSEVILGYLIGDMLGLLLLLVILMFAFRIIDGR